MNNDFELIMRTSALDIARKEIKKNNILEFLNNKTIFISQSQISINNLFNNYECVGAICDINWTSYFISNISCEYSSDLVDFIDEKLSNLTAIHRFNILFSFI